MRKLTHSANYGQRSPVLCFAINHSLANINQYMSCTLPPEAPETRHRGKSFPWQPVFLLLCLSVCLTLLFARGLSFCWKGHSSVVKFHMIHSHFLFYLIFCKILAWLTANRMQPTGFKWPPDYSVKSNH